LGLGAGLDSVVFFSLGTQAIFLCCVEACLIDRYI
jgi:hypothetical protein